ncbi:CsgG/HfaB family protein [Chitinivibrio alkaliphilus]|uniref:Curli production assembly/transport component CsgG n=1 Tax=Chitinivibrio alkaliphilus ACht1 TaxID=1313304 RepID=U7D7L4_9BACT|nr:CsgG/HfaB family protein [Chitinivibrio alkaliphilus]ERP31923.1 hypothetical protein CALK_1141 [Chitinivibrio alkaliphilus ACht1]
MKRIYITILVSLSLVYGGIGQSDWMETGQIIRYPASRYFYAVGSGSSPEGARTSAIAEVRKQISSTISTEEISAISDMYGTDGHTHETRYQQRTRITSHGDIQGVNIIATDERDGLYYAFGVLEKENFKETTRAKIQEQQEKLRDVYSRAQSAMDRSNFPTGLRYVGTARDIYSRLEANRVLLTAVTPLTDAERLDIALHDIESLYANALESLRTKKISGDRQEISTGNTLEEPFGIVVSADGQGVANIPFALVDREGKEVMRAYSDDEGEVLFFLSDRAKMRRGVHRYRVQPALRGVSRDMVERLEESFAYRVIEAPAYASITVEPMEGISPEQLSKRVQSLLGEYDIRHEECNCYHFNIELSAKKGEYIQGVSRQRTFQQVEVDATFILRDAEKEREITRFSRSASGMGNDLESGVFAALESMRLGDDMRLLKEDLEPTEDTHSETELPRVIVFPFTNSEYISNWRNISESLYNMIVTQLINSGGVTVLERQEISRLIEEQQFSSESIDMAQYLGADLAIFGAASLTGGTIEIDARIVDVETAVSRGAVSASGRNLAELRTIANSLVEEMEIDGRSLSGSSRKRSCCR